MKGAHGMTTSIDEHLRTLFRRSSDLFGDRESWPLDELSRLTGDALLHMAARSGSVEDVKLLIARGANVNLPNDDGFTPLHWSTFRDSPEVMAVLLDAGADPSLENEWGQTPLEVLKLRAHELAPEVFEQFTKSLQKATR